MLKLTITVAEEERGLALYHEVLREAPTQAEEHKLKVLLDGFLKAMLNEAERLEKAGCGKTITGPNVLALLGLKEGPVNSIK